MAILPRPILKRCRNLSPSPQSETNHPAVHFPPSPCLTRIFEVHSASIYDRSPIVVDRNNCALPERGCPGRTYYSREEESEDELMFCTRYLMNAESRELAVGSSTRGHAHPRLLARRQEEADSSSVPALIPDLSSESEESDGFITTPISLLSLSPTRPPVKCPLEKEVYSSASELDLPVYLLDTSGRGAPLPTSPITLSPLPHSPTTLSVPVQQPKSRRPRGRRIRSSSSPGRDEELEEDSGYVEDADVPSSPTITLRFSRSPSRSPPSKKEPSTCKKKSKYLLCKTLANLGFAAEGDAGCLGGF